MARFHTVITYEGQEIANGGDGDATLQVAKRNALRSVMQILELDFSGTSRSVSARIHDEDHAEVSHMNLVLTVSDGEFGPGV